MIKDGDDQYKTPDVSAAHTAGLDAASLNINKFLLETPDNQVQSSTSRSVSSSVHIDKLLLETPDNQVQSTSTNSGGKNHGSSGTIIVNKKRDIIDVDDFPMKLSLEEVQRNHYWQQSKLKKKIDYLLYDHLHVFFIQCF